MALEPQTPRGPCVRFLLTSFSFFSPSELLHSFSPGIYFLNRLPCFTSTLDWFLRRRRSRRHRAIPFFGSPESPSHSQESRLRCIFPALRPAGQSSSLQLAARSSIGHTRDASASRDLQNKTISDVVMTDGTICGFDLKGGFENTMALYLTIPDRLEISEILAKQLFSISPPHLP
jgi:hypothetical protein